VIELLGVGMRGADGQWLFRRLCAHIDSPALVVVAGPSRDAREALLDIVAGRRIADEGRAWIDRIPVMAETRRRIRRRVADIGLAELARPRWRWSSLLRRSASLPPDEAVRAFIASVVAHGRRPVILRDLDRVLTPPDVVSLGQHLRGVARALRCSILLGVSDVTLLREAADEVLVIGGARFATARAELQLVG
jgi:hypothetical protein